mmetsp:Transcript_76794/g.248689  ORF Transcript_76794/g.248689 Transcript_76794/m.248689 type:complete len:115 (-) Transcript_76794:582-926(-)
MLKDEFADLPPLPRVTMLAAATASATAACAAAAACAASVGEVEEPPASETGPDRPTVRLAAACAAVDAASSPFGVTELALAPLRAAARSGTSSGASGVDTALDFGLLRGDGWKT